jgi:hypothetical protein
MSGRKRTMGVGVRGVFPSEQVGMEAFTWGARMSRWCHRYPARPIDGPLRTAPW